MTQLTHLQTVLAKRGQRLSDLARAMKVDRATVTRWSKSDVPAHRVAEIAKQTGIPAHELRPDLAKAFRQ